MFAKPKVPKKIFYQQLSIRVNELENKKQIKCIYVGPKMKEEKELILYPNKNGTVADLLEEAKKQIEFSEGSTGKLRSDQHPLHFKYDQKIHLLSIVVKAQIILIQVN